MSLETLTPTLASSWILEVDTSATTTPEWTRVRAIQSFAPNINDQTADASDFDSDGWASTFVTQRAWVNIATVLRKVDDTAAHDPGQEALRLAAWEKVLAHVRWYDTTSASAEAYEGEASVMWAPQGGSVTDLQTVQVTLNGQGAPREIANPTV